MKAQECLTELLAEVQGVGTNLFLKNVDNPLERLYELVVVNVVDQLEVDADDLREAWADELDRRWVI